MYTKIAIPTDDKQTVAPHFGRAGGFMIYDVSNGKVLGSEYRANDFTGHARGQHHQHEAHGAGHGGHSHKGILDNLGDCKAVISGGMGQRLFNDLAQHKIEVLITRESNLDRAVELYLSGGLDSSGKPCCH